MQKYLEILLLGVLSPLFLGSAIPTKAPIVEKPNNQLVIPYVPAYWVPSEFKSLLVAADLEAGVPIWLHARLLAHESGFNPKAFNLNTNGTSDGGVAQLNNSKECIAFFTELHRGRYDRYNPKHAITISARYLRYLYEQTGSWYLACIAYNRGLLGMQRPGPLPKGTVALLNAVFRKGGVVLPTIEEIEAVKQVCTKIGYAATMRLASTFWRGDATALRLVGDETLYPVRLQDIAPDKRHLYIEVANADHS